MNGIVRWVCAALIAALALPAQAAHPGTPIHGLWVWKTSTVLQAPQGQLALEHFCRSAGITEVYVSVPAHHTPLEDAQLAQVISLLHRSNIRVEALTSSVDGDEAGRPRAKLLDHVQSILQFNRQHEAQQFDGIHLDIEPQQRPENKGPGNLQFLPGLVETYRAVRAITDRAGITLNADIQNKLLKGDLEQRRLLLSSVPRLTLMLYELSSPDDGTMAADKKEKLRVSSEKFFEIGYQGLDAQSLAKMTIALRTPDYGQLLPQMLASLDVANQDNPHYLGWAQHSYNDMLAGMAAAAAR